MLKGDFKYSIGEVLSMSDYEQIMYDLEICTRSEKPEEPGPDPVQVEEEPLDSLRESSHG